jgi:hypothetical protein
MSRSAAARYSVVAYPWLNYRDFSIFDTSSGGIGAPVW